MLGSFLKQATVGIWETPIRCPTKLIGARLKSGIGAELRIATSAYYLFPIKFFVSGAYGFDRFSVELPDDFVTPATGNRVNYGGELLFHFGLTFDFELL